MSKKASIILFALASSWAQTTIPGSVTVCVAKSCQTFSITIQIPITPISLVCDKTVAVPGDSINCTVTISAAAPAGGQAVSVSGANVVEPASVLVPAGAVSVTFTGTVATPPNPSGSHAETICREWCAGPAWWRVDQAVLVGGSALVPARWEMSHYFAGCPYADGRGVCAWWGA